ncbi:sodium pump decarboxylase, gamma subunit [Bifidobacterium gallicum DSM 20093 = LMG 11596]|nr:sodium pump decarboxylase, gamma subunit [Bifidobacterium gallicum DSM 20093 = LMG 11596]
MFVLLVLLLIIISSCGGSSSHSSSSGYYSNQVSSANTSGDIPASTTDREKADAGISFTTDCITDQIGWVSNPTATCKNMKDFYSKTGLQPMVLLKSYDSSLKTDDEKYDYAQQYYTDHITNEGSVLYVYFAEQDEENDVGYMALINGKQAGAVMDAEARDIFWAYLDSYWYSDMDMGDVLSTTYNNTANRIMTKTTTKADIIKAVIIGLIVVIVVVSVVILVVKLVKEKNRRAKEEAEETERILNTPLQNEADPMLAKYETSSESQPATQPPGTDGTGSAGQQ